MTEFGGPEVLELAELPDPEPGPGEVLIRVTRAGLNFADTHTRTNSYVQKATLPLVPGGEVAGVARGHRRARRRARRQRRLRRVRRPRPTELVFPIPDGARRRHGAGADRPGHDRLAPVPHRRRGWRQGESVVVHGAAGGVGSLAVQLGHPLGAGRVIATASSEEQARARAGARRRRGGRPRARRADRAAARGQRRRARRRRLRDVRRRGVRRLLRGRSRPSGGSSSTGSPPNEPNQVSTGSLLRHSRAVVGFYLFHCLRAPGDVRRRARRPVRARRARRAEGGRGRHLPARRRPPRRRSTCASGARPASSCSIPLPKLRTHGHLRRSRAVRATLQALRDVGYEAPSPIQEQAIPALLAGPRRDRPGADRHRQDGGVRAADHGVHRPDASRACRRSC